MSERLIFPACCAIGALLLLVFLGRPFVMLSLSALALAGAVTIHYLQRR